MTTPTPAQIATASEVLAKIALNDYQFAKPDPGMAVAWAECFAVYGLERAELLHAVVKLFADTERPRDRVLPADVIKRAREIRRQRAEREKSEGAVARELLTQTRRAIAECRLCDPNGWIETPSGLAKCSHGAALPSHSVHGRLSSRREDGYTPEPGEDE